MDRGTISGRYAMGLYKYARKYNKEESIYKATIALSNSYKQYPALNRALDNPIAKEKEKEKLLMLCVGDNASYEFHNFIKLVILQNREEFLKLICFNYQEIYRQEMNLLHINITTAIPIDESTIQEIRSKIEKLTQKKIDVSVAVEPQIIGGYVIQWDTYRWDASVSSQLKRIEKELKDSVKIK